MESWLSHVSHAEYGSLFRVLLHRWRNCFLLGCLESHYRCHGDAVRGVVQVVPWPGAFVGAGWVNLSTSSTRVLLEILLRYSWCTAWRTGAGSLSFSIRNRNRFRCIIALRSQQSVAHLFLLRPAFCVLAAPSKFSHLWTDKKANSVPKPCNQKTKALRTSVGTCVPTFIMPRCRVLFIMVFAACTNRCAFEIQR